MSYYFSSVKLLVISTTHDRWSAQATYSQLTNAEVGPELAIEMGIKGNKSSINEAALPIFSVVRIDTDFFVSSRYFRVIARKYLKIMEQLCGVRNLVRGKKKRVAKADYATLLGPSDTGWLIISAQTELGVNEKPLNEKQIPINCQFTG